MNDKWAAEISIGGTISRTTAKKLISAICEENISLGYGEAIWQPSSIEDLLKGLSLSGLLVLRDDQAACGIFEDFERFLQLNDIPFDRNSLGYQNYNSEVVQFRPSSVSAGGTLIGRHEWMTNAKGTKLVPRERILLATQEFEKCVATSAKPENPAVQQGHIDRFLKILRKAIGPSVPDLTPLEVLPAVNT